MNELQKNNESDVVKVDEASNSGTCSFAPKLNCPKFSGKNCEDKFAFKNFLTQFQNCMVAVKCKAIKLQYLRGYLADYALQIIQHLTITNENYDVAIQLLKEEYWDHEYIVNEILKQISENKPVLDSEFEGVKQYLTKVRADLLELKNSFELNFLENNTPGNKYVSYTIFSRLPSVLKREIIRIAGTNYPSLMHIFDNYNEVIKTLAITRFKYNTNKEVKCRSDKVSNLNKSCSALQNFKTPNYMQVLWH